jgi:hypothetical protein
MAKQKLTEAQAREWADKAMDAVQDLHTLKSELDKMKAEDFSDEALKIVGTLIAVSRIAAVAAGAVLVHHDISAAQRKIESTEK